MMFYLSIVSHNSEDYILNNKSLLAINKNEQVIIIIKDNVGSEKLELYCSKNNIHYIDGDKGLGFGANNNYIYNYAHNDLNIKSDDYFIVINPDVYIENLYFDALVSYLKINSPDLFTIDLYKDSVYTERDNFIREYPNVIDFFSSFL